MLYRIGTLKERKLDFFTVLSVMVQRKAYLIVAQMKEMVDVEQLKMLLSYAMVFLCVCMLYPSIATMIESAEYKNPL